MRIIWRSLLFVLFFIFIPFSVSQGRTLAFSARAFYSGVYSESLANVFKLDSVNSAYGFIINADFFLGKKFSLGAVIDRTFVGSYQQYYMGYGTTMKIWSGHHYWNLGAIYLEKNTSAINNLNAPQNLVLGQFSLGLFGGEGINWVFEIPIQAGMELNTQVFYGDIGIQAGLLFNI